MNLGEKIKSLREAKGLSVEELSIRINDSTENLLKYESNELEPTLDKKLALSIELEVSLSDLSYNIEQKYTKIEKNIQEENINLVAEETVFEEKEEPFAKSSITYNEDVFNQVFRDSHIRSSIQSAIFILGYIICGFFTINGQLTIFSYLCFGIAIISTIKLIMQLSRFKVSKRAWLQEYSHTTREYHYYKNYFEVINDNNEVKKVMYNQIIRIIESKNFIVALHYSEVPTFIVIDTSSFIDDELIKVRTAFKENCHTYIDVNQQKKDKNLDPKMRSWNILLWVFAILALFSITIVNFSVRIFTKDNNLFVSLLIYGLATILPIVSIILGIVSKKKKDFQSSKNVIIGIIMLIGCIVFMGLSVVQNKIYKAHNNDKLVEYIETHTFTDMPSDYNTIYIDTDKKEEIRGSNKYIIDSYSAWSFGKYSEIESLEETIQSKGKWIHNTSTLQNLYGFELNNDLKSILNSLGHKIVDEADYIMIINLSTNECNNLIASTGDKYLSLMYFDEGNYMVVVEFTYEAALAA